MCGHHLFMFQCLGGWFLSMISTEDPQVLVKQVSDFIRFLKLNVSQKWLNRSDFSPCCASC